MRQTEWIELTVALLCMVLGGLATASEAAFTSISKVRAQRLVSQQRPGAEKLLEMTQDAARFRNTLLFVQVILEVSACVLVAVVCFVQFDATWERIVFPILIMLVVGFIGLGVAPRTLGRQHAEPLALRSAGALRALAAVFGSVSGAMILVGNAITPGKGFAEGPFASEAELRELVDIAESRDLIEDEERKMIHSVFDLGDTIVKEVMVPRTDMVWIEAEKTVRQGTSLALRSGFSRIPVVGNDIDDIVGILYIKDVMRRIYDNAAAQTSEKVASLMRPATFVPDSKPVDDLLREMQRTRSHVVIVIDEFGGTAGLATIEDVLEEIVGEIVDEYDNEVAAITDMGEGKYRVSARLPVDELGELFGLDVDDEDVETALGLMAKQLNTVPIPGSQIVWEGIELEAEQGTGRRNQISTLLATKAVVPGNDEAEDADSATSPQIAAMELSGAEKDVK